MIFFLKLRDPDSNMNKQGRKSPWLMVQVPEEEGPIVADGVLRKVYVKSRFCLVRSAVTGGILTHYVSLLRKNR
jgi:hypothetical protein